MSLDASCYPASVGWVPGRITLHPGNGRDKPFRYHVTRCEHGFMEGLCRERGCECYGNRPRNEHIAESGRSRRAGYHRPVKSLLPDGRIMCSVCREPKESEEFWRCSYSATGRQTACIVCARKRKAIWEAEHRKGRRA